MTTEGPPSAVVVVGAGHAGFTVAGVGGVDDREVVPGDQASGKFSVLRFDGDRLVCGESVNNSGDHVSLRTVLAHGRDDEVVRTLRAEPGTADLRQLARSLRRFPSTDPREDPRGHASPVRPQAARRRGGRVLSRDR